MESLGMALFVRNIFFDCSQEEDGKQHGRSNSAPPACRQATREKGDYDSAAVSTTCETLEPNTPTVVSEDDDAVSLSSYLTEHGDCLPSISRQELELDSDDDADWPQSLPQSLAPDHQEPSQTSTQQELEQMSQMVLEIWSKLRSVESSIEAQCGESAAEAKSQVPQIPAPSEIKQLGQAPACQKLVSNACPFVPSSGSSEVHSVLSKVGQALTSTHGVAYWDVNLGFAGTLATLTVRLDSNASKSSVIAASKSALLEAAVSSQSTYVLGYEASPFQDDMSGSGFCAELAACPVAWECSACWDTYTMGFCSRKRNCKWQHPGRNELQPVRVVVY